MDARNRDRLLDELEAQRFDCVVIGGGITGAGIAREGARAGLRIAVIEQGDFASGTSSRSSKLIHGGLRYLPQGDVPLVRKTALERKVIHGLAKHLCEPRWMVFPTKSFRAQTTMRMGVTTYEKLGAVDDADVHQTWDRDELLEHEPSVDRERYSGAVVFREYVTDDARLVLANLRAAVADGAVAANHLEAIELSGDPATSVTARCHRTGREVTVQATVVINAGGPWVDSVRRLESDAERRLMLSKGIHIVVPPALLPVDNMVTVTTADKRTVFVIAQHDGVYIGTTDVLTSEDATTWPTVDRSDVEYLLDAIELGFDVAPIRADDIVAAWAGLRPLVAEEGKEPGEISRKDEIWVGPRGVVTMAGGKLTGYRPMAIDALERAATVGGFTFRTDPDDAGAVLPGGDFDGEVWDLAAALAADHDLDQRTADRLARLYGSEAAAVLERGSQPVLAGASVVVGEVAHAIEVEAAARLDDLVYRRTRAAWFSADPMPLAAAIGRLAAPLLEWYDDELAAQLESVESIFRSELAFKET